LTATPAYRVRRLVRRELAACQALAHSQGWSTEDRKWRLLFDIGEVYGAVSDTGGLLSTVTVARFGPRAAAISMVLTEPCMQGRGLAREVMRHAMAAAGDGVLCLYATDNGRPLYEQLNFSAVVANTMYLGTVTGAVTAPVSRPAVPDDLPGMLAADRLATGADRCRLVTRLFDFATRLHVVEQHGHIAGYGGTWRNDTNLVVGPVIAPDSALATGLITDLVADVTGPVRLEARADRPALRDWATAHGLEPGFTTHLMVHDGRDLPGEEERCFVPVMVALG
jgi:GNAT superfamily N-acetyltransferase